MADQTMVCGFFHNIWLQRVIKGQKYKGGGLLVCAKIMQRNPYDVQLTSFGSNGFI